MLLNWDYKNLCIVSSQWHIHTVFDLIASLIAVVLLGMGYEALRAGSRKYELAVARRVDAAPSKSSSPSASPPTPLLSTPSPVFTIPVYPCVSFIQALPRDYDGKERGPCERDS